MAVLRQSGGTKGKPLSYLVHERRVLRVAYLFHLDHEGADGGGPADLAALGRDHLAGQKVQGLEQERATGKT